MTGIIILNWNGWEDTIECLKSLNQINDTDFFIVLADNGSTNNSVLKIKSYLNESKLFEFYNITESCQELPNIINNKTCILYELEDNYGFAKGNNKGIEIAKKFSPEYYILLNNDTVVEPDFLSELISFINNKPQYSVLTPRISYYFNKDLIWNCGGALHWGFRKYYYANKSISTIKEKSHIDIGYVTGCALFFKAEIIKDYPLLTERFFHGEEDFEFSYRMRRLGIKIACVLSSHIYHKVGVSTKELNNVGKKYTYYLLRFIDMRQQMHPISFKLWKIVYTPYIYVLLKRNGIKFKTIAKLVKKLKREANELDGVTKEKFFELLKNGI